MSYVNVYEITRDSVPLWFPVVFIFIVLGCIGVWWEFRNMGAIKKAARRFLLLPVCLWLILFYVYHLGRKPYVQAYKSGNYLSVEGPVEHSSRRGKSECFTVRGAEFCHSCVDVVTINFFRRGFECGLVSGGRPVRVAAYNGRILRLDVGSVTSK